MPQQSAKSASDDAGSKKPETKRVRRSWFEWLFQPRSFVFAILLGVLTIGGWIRLAASWRARRAAGRLEESDITPDEVRLAAEHGRIVLPGLMAMLEANQTTDTRRAAGAALSRLWLHDQLVAEEEQAIARDAHEVHWEARRTYPRTLRCAIPLRARFDLFFIDSDTTAESLKADHFQISHWIKGANRLSLETPSDWHNSVAPIEFLIDPTDFPAKGPHVITLHARIRTVGLTSDWVIELPPRSLTIEFDDRIEIEALYAQPDSDREEQIHSSIRLERETASADQPAMPPLLINDAFAIRDAPYLVVTTQLPCDFAHSVHLEFEEVPGRLQVCGFVCVAAEMTSESHRHISLLPSSISSGQGSPQIQIPGEYRMRVVLTPDAQQGWLHPNVRSVWPGVVVTPWQAVRVERR